MLRICRSGGGEIIVTVTISNMKETQAYMWMKKHTLNTRMLWNIAFEKIRFGRKDYYGN